MIAKGVVITLPVLSGAAARHVAELRHQRYLESRFKERHQIARELHDTLAHRMTAIAIQAQAWPRIGGIESGSCTGDIGNDRTNSVGQFAGHA